MLISPVQYELKLPEGSPRATGIHVSDIIRRLAFKFDLLDKKWENAELDIPTVFLGLAFEDLYFKQHPLVLHQPGEEVLDDIYMNADGVSADGDHYFVRLHRVNETQTIVHESKTTKKSKPKNDQELLTDNKWWMWRVQMMAYCWLYQTQAARLHALFINGGYEWHRGGNTALCVWDLWFTMDELRKNWQMLRIEAKEMR